MEKGSEEQFFDEKQIKEEILKIRESFYQICKLNTEGISDIVKIFHETLNVISGTLSRSQLDSVTTSELKMIFKQNFPFELKDLIEKLHELHGIVERYGTKIGLVVDLDAGKILFKVDNLIEKIQEFSTDIEAGT